MSSSCSSSTDLGIGPDPDDAMADSLVSGVEALVECINLLRNTLESKPSGGGSKCVEVHEALTQVSHAIRDLLAKYPAFKTSQILIPTSQLVHSVKGINFDTADIDASQSLQAIARLEAAVGSALKNWHSASSNGSLLSGSKHLATPEGGEVARPGDQRASNWMARLGKRAPLLHKQLSENEVEHGMHDLAHGLMQNGNGVDEPHKPYADLRRRYSNLQPPSSTPHMISSPSQPRAARLGTNARLALTGKHRSLEEGQHRIKRLVHQNSTAVDEPAHPSMQDLLVGHENGIELAFDQCKTWSRYASQLLAFVRSRLALEHEYSRNLQKLAEQTKSILAGDPQNSKLPLIGVFGQLLEHDQQLAPRYGRMIAALSHHFVTALESRQREHDVKRRKLKAEWIKQRKQLDACMEELKRARHTLLSKEDGYLKVRGSTLRLEQQHSVPASSGGSMNSVNSEPQKRRKELEKRKKTEEDALIRKTDAENEVWRLEGEAHSRLRILHTKRVETIGALCDLIRHCNLTITACGSHFFKAFSELWAPLPNDYEQLAQLIRESTPGNEYMSFLQNQQEQQQQQEIADRGRSISAASSSASPNAASTAIASNSLDVSSSTSTTHQIGSQSPFSTGYASGPSSSSASQLLLASPPPMARRRNALNADEHYMLIAETSQRRQKKSSMTRLFESPMPSLHHYSEAARSHQLQRTRQVAKCAQCEHVAIFDALKCQACGILLHKKCLSSVTTHCGKQPSDALAQKRMSIFGVPLKGHLDAQRREIPLILEKCIDELQRRGMSCKGIYRTCGVKSKIEQICVYFEQSDSSVDDPNLSDVHPMNIASVVKLYLRRLPEPLMTYELYEDWLQFDASQSSNDSASKASTVRVLRDVVSRLPHANYSTLKYLMLHLKRVTWFRADNLMTHQNLATVITPSLVWSPAMKPDGPPASAEGALRSFSTSFINEAHHLTRAVECLIDFAHDVFLVDESTDWSEFFERYPHLGKPHPREDTQPEAIGGSEKVYFGLDHGSSAEAEELGDEELFDEDEFGAMCDDDDVIHVQSLQSPAQNNHCTGKQARDQPANNTIAACALATPTISHKQMLKNVGKQRSFTTSILVSPPPDRKFPAIAQQQKFCDVPYDGSKQHESRNGVELDESGGDRNNLQTLERKRTLRSGEVIVDMKREQFCPPENHPSSAANHVLSSASFSSTGTVVNAEQKAVPKMSNGNMRSAAQIPRATISKRTADNNTGRTIHSSRPETSSGTENSDRRNYSARNRLQLGDFTISTNDVSYV